MNSLPPELIERIFILAGNPYLSITSTQFKIISKRLKTKARWLMYKYGPNHVMSNCWKWKFFGWSEMPKFSKKEPGLCQCHDLHSKKKWTRQESQRCPVEDTQIQLCQYLLDMGASVSAGDDRSLKLAARCGHLALVHLLLMAGANPNATVSYRESFLPFTKPSLGGNRSSIFPIGNSEENISNTASSSHPPLVTSPTILTPELRMIAFGRDNNAQQNSNESVVRSTDALLGNPETHQEPPQEELNPTQTRRRRKQVELLLQAVQRNNISLVELLIMSSRPRVLNIPPRTSSLPRQHSSTINPPSPEPEQPQISQTTLEHALLEALESNKVEIARILIKQGGAKATSDMMHALLQKAGSWRLGLGLRDKFTELIELCIHSLSDEDFDRISSGLVRHCAEIGTVGGIKACVERGADINVWEGLALYSSVYSGNVEVTRYLIHRENVPNLNLDHFGAKQMSFCLALIMIEGFAIGMFIILVAIWAVGIAHTSGTKSSTFSIDNSSRQVSFSEISTMAIPAAIALVIMYRLVPLHRLLFSFILAVSEKRKRSQSTQPNMTQV